MSDSPSSQGNPFRTLEQKRAFEGILAQVEEAIVTGLLKPGDRLPPEREMAEMFGVSRQSVREALRALEVFGVVAARRGRGPDSGSFVAYGTQTGLQVSLRLHVGLMRIPTRDIVQIRTVLESFAASQAARLAEPESTINLENLVDAMLIAERALDFNELDTEFHVELASISGNALLPVLMGGLRSVMKREMVNSFAELTDWKQERDRLVTEHREIIALIKKGDAESAAGLVRDHVMLFYSSVMDNLDSSTNSETEINTL